MKLLQSRIDKFNEEVTSNNETVDETRRSIQFCA